MAKIDTAWSTILRVTLVPFAQINFTDTPDRITCKGTFEHIIKIETETILDYGRS